MLTKLEVPVSSTCHWLILGWEIHGEREGVISWTVFPSDGCIFSLERVAAVSDRLWLQDTHKIEEIYF